jgi:hypothetical protein
MSRSENVNRGQFSLLYALLSLTMVCLILGSWAAAESHSAPDWVFPFCGVGILGGFYGLVALAVFQFTGE